MTIYLGENIKRLRLEKGLTQEILADFLGVTFQSVSRWERGEGYPDITILPVIARFFNVSIDDLLGVNKAENEEEITAKLEEYDNLRREWENEKRKLDIITSLMEKYPNDFRVQLKYMEHLLTFTKIADSKSKILSLYENIQRSCTVDSIRIKAKKLYLYCCTDEEAAKIVSELPEIENCQEACCWCYTPDTPERYDAICEALENEAGLFFSTLADFSFDSSRYSRDYSLQLLERIKDFLNFLYNDGNYGKMWTYVINYCYGITGLFYYLKGDNEKALFNLRKSAELAVQFDNLDRITTLHSTLFEGKTFDKHTLGSDFNAKKYRKELLTELHGFSEEFKSTPEFKEIIAMLG